MINNRCKTCLWWDNQHISVTLIPEIQGKPNPGFCRKKRPNIIGFKEHHLGAQPIMDENEFCGEYKEDI